MHLSSVHTYTLRSFIKLLKLAQKMRSGAHHMVSGPGSYHESHLNSSIFVWTSIINNLTKYIIEYNSSLHDCLKERGSQQKYEERSISLKSIRAIQWKARREARREG